MLAIELFWFYTWWGTGGLFAGLFVFPIAAVFPFIFLIKEGFSLIYFGLWAAGLAGAFVAYQDE